MSGTDELSQWWYLDLAAEYPEIEMYTGHGWGPAQELSQYELGERVALEEALWLPTWFYSKARDRHWAAVARMFAMVVEAVRAKTGKLEVDPREDIPPGWLPDVDAWDAGKFNDPSPAAAS